MGYTILICFVCMLCSIAVENSISYDTSCICPEECDCSKEYQNMTLIECFGVTEFPTFPPFDCQISEVIIQGNFTKITANGFYNLKWINYGIALKRSAEDAMVPINIDDGAFNFARNFPISLSFYSFQALTSVPDLQNVTLSELTFDNSGLFFLSNGPFNGLSVYIIRVVNGTLVEPDETMFQGMTIFQPAGLSLDFSENNIDDIPLVVKVPYVTSIDLSGNVLRELPSSAFVCIPCDNNGTIREINLNSNPYVNYDLNAFSNLPFLSSLSLQHTSLTTIPTEYLQPVSSTLKYLDLEFNTITKIPKDIFSGFTSLINVNLNGNPISNIEIGAFNGTNAMTTLFLNNFDLLISVDLLLTSGMVNVHTLNLAYNGNLTEILLSDPSLMPASLRIVDVSHDNIETIEPTVGDWLGMTNANVMIISFNYNFTCSEDIKWMAEYVLCQPIQIYANQTICDNEEPLETYLKRFMPSC